MKASLLCLTIVFSAVLNLNAAEVTTIYTPSEDFEEVIRGQSPPPTYEETAPYGSNIPPNGSYTVPEGQAFDPNMGGGNLYGAPQGGYDPFLSPGMGGGDPYGGQGMPGYSGSVNGPQPYRFGWSSKYEFGFMPKVRTYVSPTGANGGNFGVFETDIDLTYTTPTKNGWIFAFSPEVDYRGWDGPQFISLPGKGFRFASDFQLSTPANGLWSVQLGFTPAIGTDFGKSLSSDAWMFDARAVLFFRPSNTWMFAAGAAYWDRVGDYVIPYAGIVWTPNDLWEVRAMFPKARVSRFMGNVGDKSVWLYGSFEYDIEAFQIQQAGVNARNQVEFKDYVMLLGVRGDSGCMSIFLEAGGIMKREADFKNGGGFDVKDGFIARFGVQF
ncbi:MAG: hypothetical protein ABIK07_13720 [Planctomycetota bacterium]|uniref:hypothetical protein n=1 Tax=uncultured Gimesia sp. TaxID=1678688 RepID=UPI00261CA455|nr:hypothetical protein [uncultured Gimesia sp.]